MGSEPAHYCRATQNGCLRIENIRVGQKLPLLCHRIDISGMIMYAAATWDFHRCHYDHVFATNLGFPGVVVDGQMLGGLLAKQLMRWAGSDALLRELSYQVRQVVVPGDQIASRGHITGVRRERETAMVTCELTVTKQDSSQVIRGARAVIEVPMIFDGHSRQHSDTPGVDRLHL